MKNYHKIILSTIICGYCVISNFSFISMSGWIMSYVLMIIMILMEYRYNNFFKEQINSTNEKLKAYTVKKVLKYRNDHAEDLKGLKRYEIKDNGNFHGDENGRFVLAKDVRKIIKKNESTDSKE